MTSVKITTPFIKLDSFLKFAGIVSTGGEAKMMISDGVVLVDGEVCSMRGKKIYPESVVTVDGEEYKAQT